MDSWTEQTDRYFRSLDLANLKVDEAYLNVTSTLSTKIWMYFLSEECHRCPYTKLKEIQPNNDNILQVNTARKVNWKFFQSDHGSYINNDSNNDAICTLQYPEIGEFGIYDLEINENGKCDIVTVKDPVNIYWPILFVALMILALVIILNLSQYFFKKYRQRQIENRTESDDKELDSPTKVIKPRLRSLDTFRGISIVLMIFVNSGGGHYWWIEHATWNGLHIADLVFPWFLWIMGVCIPMSIKSQISRNVTKQNMLLNVLRRSITLFAIGLCLNTISGSKLENLRIFGVLQRFGIAYLVVASLHIILARPVNIAPQNTLRRGLYDIIVLWPQWIVIIALIVIHLAITFGLQVPNCPTGYLGPGGKHDMRKYNDCIGGATGYIDRLILGSSHIYQHPTAKYVYDSQAFDPEGILGCLLTIVQVFLGVQCGMTLIVVADWKGRVKRWLAWGIATGLIGSILSLFSQENGWIPINKNLWSLSFVLVTTSLAFILLTICFMVIDVRNIWSGTPFLYAGMNAIIMYVGHTVCHKMLPWHWQIGPMNTHFILLLESTWNTVLWIGIAYYLYRKKFFYSI